MGLFRETRSKPRVSRKLLKRHSFANPRWTGFEKGNLARNGEPHSPECPCANPLGRRLLSLWRAARTPRLSVTRAPRRVDQNAPHHLSRYRKEVGPVLPVYVRNIGQQKRPAVVGPHGATVRAMVDRQPHGRAAYTHIQIDVEIVLRLAVPAKRYTVAPGCERGTKLGSCRIE